MPLKLDATYRCDWVLENNGVVKSLWLMGGNRPHGPFYMIVETPRDDGVPQVGDFLSLTGKSGQKQGNE